MLKCLNKAVAVNSDASEVVVATRFWQRIGIDLLRGNCRCFHRRLSNKHEGVGSGGSHFHALAGLALAGGG